MHGTENLKFTRYVCVAWTGTIFDCESRVTVEMVRFHKLLECSIQVGWLEKLIILKDYQSWLKLGSFRIQVASGKGKDVHVFNWVPHYKTYGRMEIEFHSYCSSVQDIGKWLDSHPSHFNHGGAHWIGNWVGINSGLSAVGKQKSFPYRE
jgi:hypothetical protein